MQTQSSYKVHLNTICNGELSDPLCDSVNRGLTLVRLIQMHESTSVKIDRVIPQNLCFPEACHLDSAPSAGLGPVLAVISVE